MRSLPQTKMSDSFLQVESKSAINRCMEWRGKTQVHTEVQWLYCDSGMMGGHPVKLMYSHYVMCAGQFDMTNKNTNTSYSYC